MSVLVEDPNGNVELTYQGKESTENLVKEVRFYPNGDTLSVTPMKNSVVHGVLSNYHAGNVIKDRTNFVQGKANGLYRQYDTNGQVVFEGMLKDGLKEGEWLTWYDESQLQEKRSYSNDLPDGKWSYWYIDGTLKREEVYEFGKLIEAKDLN